MPNLIAGAHANCKRAEFSAGTPQWSQDRERGREGESEREEEEVSGRKAIERREKEKEVWGEGENK